MECVGVEVCGDGGEKEKRRKKLAASYHCLQVIQ